MTMKLRNCNLFRFLTLVLVMALLVPMFPAVRAEAPYTTIDFSQSVLASRINQRVGGDCAVASMSTIESFMHGVTSEADKEIVYNAVVEANGDDDYAYWDNVGYLVYDEVDWEVIYERLTWGVPSIIHRTKGSNAVQHWAVVAGYNGSETELQWDKFIVVDVYMGSGLKDIKSTATWGSGCEINWMALRGSGMNISLYAKTLLDLGEEFYGSICRGDTPGQLLTVAEDKEDTSVFAAAEDLSDRQRWKFTLHSDGGYVIESLHNGMVLTVDEGSSTDGTPICLAEDQNSKYQRWFIYQTEAGYMLESKGTAKALSIHLGDPGYDVSIHTYGQTPPQNLQIHVHEYEKIDIAATCDEGSYIKHQCIHCADVYTVAGEEGPTGHKWETLEVIEPDCQHTQLTRTHCVTCEKIEESYEEIAYSDWSEEEPENIAESAVETQKQYRFRDRFSNWAEPVEHQLLYVQQWPEGFHKESDYYTQFNNAPKESYQTETQWLNVVANEVKGYVYYHWCGGTGHCDTGSEAFPTFHAFYSTNEATEIDDSGAYYCGNLRDCPGCSYFIWYYRVPVYQQTYMLHQKLDDTELWTEWSAWSTTEVTPTDDRQVEERSVYRHVTNFGDHRFSDSYDTECDLCGFKRKVEKIETTPMYRLYNPNSGEHFYTGSVEERDNLESLGWQYEGVAWNAPTNRGTPVYRLFNPNNGDHHYTMSEEERDMLVNLGWQYEGVAWNSASPSNIPMFRLFNPNADCGSHHYTGSTEERDYLVSLGWHYEGIGWYGMLK